MSRDSLRPIEPAARIIEADMVRGFALFGVLLLNMYSFAAQIVACRWWLRRYRLGPMEWLWRSLTYLKWQPLRHTR